MVIYNHKEQTNRISKGAISYGVHGKCVGGAEGNGLLE